MGDMPVVRVMILAQEIAWWNSRNNPRKKPRTKMEE
jgi:hypothetical protein